MTRRAATALTLIALLSLAACGGDEDAQNTAGDADADFPEFTDAHLKHGRAVWMETCKGCHAYGFAGSPKAGDAKAWAPRISKGREQLYAHAIEGFFGPKGTMMPARGGNDALSDADVKSAVDYMIALVQPQT